MAKSSQVIDVSFWVLLGMAVATVNLSIHYLDRSDLSNVGYGWWEAASIVKLVLPRRWMIWEYQGRRDLFFSQKSLMLEISSRVMLRNTLTSGLWSMATPNWWQPSVKSSVCPSTHVIASAFSSISRQSCLVEIREWDPAIVMCKLSEQQSGLKSFQIWCFL